MSLRPTDPPGVYAIINTVNGKRYIGSATQPKHRWCWHRQYLRRGDHPNPHLQASVNKYGIGVFRFEVVEFVLDPFWLRAREQAWILREEVAHPDWGYNRMVDAFGGLISQEAREHHRCRTKEAMARVDVRERLSQGQTRRYADPALRAEHRTAHARLEVRQKRSSLAQARLADPATRAVWVVASHSPAASKKRSASLITANQDPGVQARRSQAQVERRRRERADTDPAVLAAREVKKKQKKLERQRVRRAANKQVA